MMPAAYPSRPRYHGLMSDPSLLSSVHCTLEQAIEAVVSTSDKTVSPAKLAQAMVQCGFEGCDSATVREAVETLNRSYAEGGRCFEIVEIAGGFRLATRASVTGVLATYHGVRAAGGLTRAAIETLAVVAYRQPVTRAEVEAIRGVACGEVLRSLMDRKLVTIAGRSEDLGRPMLYGTTKEFLEVFGLASIKQLPDADGVHDESMPEPVPEPPAEPASEPVVETVEPVGPVPASSSAEAEESAPHPAEEISE